ncbi:Oligopeptide ABC transporter, periplasmic oligopeptide-binding protein OppA (TC 3.A.1.5.1) [hydrothermal vent metagenome]|uniref:Oligopeptide ABC transporter, periplasmic oligopeptide-binding protein OppA (TC 3.A.1.5.1) n=1 Tax=hydrothermal vent metagenome TaxID=652676 RepID=A0A3B0R6W6_9ZZZZ
MLTNKLKFLFVAIAALLILAACSSEADKDTAGLKVLHRGNSAEPLSLDPHKANGTWENNIIGDMFIGLFTESAAGDPIPGMAESWSVSDDGLRWEFDLIDTVWSDGVPVTADDFVYSFRRILNPDTQAQYASLIYPIKNAAAVHAGEKLGEALGVTALGPRKLRIDLEYPAPYFTGLLTHYTTFPIPKHVVEKFGDNWVKPENIQVNGPYKLVQWRTNDFVLIERNPKFYDNENVCLDEVYYYAITDSNTAERQVREGRLDVNNEFPGRKMEFLSKELPGYVRVHPYLGTTYFSFNMTKKPFDDKRVRLALSMALDRDHITQNVIKSGYISAYSLVPPGIGNYAEGAIVSWATLSFEQRRMKAKELLQQAGFGPDNPLQFEFVHRSTGDNPAAAPGVQSDWNSIAPWVNVTIAQLETQILYENLRTGDFSVSDGAWVADYNDVSNFLYLMETRAGPMNYSRYSNPEYDQLMAAANREMDMVKRAGMMKKAEQMMLDDMPIAPMWYLVNKALVNPKVTGWKDNIVDLHRSRFLCLSERG